MRRLPWWLWWGLETGAHAVARVPGIVACFAGWHRRPLRDHVIPGFGVLHLCDRCGLMVRATIYPT